MPRPSPTRAPSSSSHMNRCQTMRSWIGRSHWPSSVGQVGDEVVALPLLREQVALAGLLVVVRPRDPRAGERGPRRPGPARRAPALRRLAQPARDRRLVVDVRVLRRRRRRSRPSAPSRWLVATAAVLGLVDRQLQVVRPDAVALGVAVGERPPDEHLVVGEVEPVDEHAGAERDLLVLGEEVRRRCGRAPSGRPAAAGTRSSGHTLVSSSGSKSSSGCSWSSIIWTRSSHSG